MQHWASWCDSNCFVMFWYDISRVSSLSVSFVSVVWESGDMVLSGCLLSGGGHLLGVCWVFREEFSLLWE